MAIEEGSGSTSSFDDVMADVRRVPVRRVTVEDRDANRDVDDALEDENAGRDTVPDDRYLGSPRVRV